MAFEIALPEDDNRSFGDYLDALKRRRKPALLIALTLLLLGGVAIVVWPNAYTSTAVILIEDPDIPPGLVPSTVVTYAAKQIQYINQRVMTRTNLANIIEKFNLFADERKYLPTLLLVPDVEKRRDRGARPAPVPRYAGAITPPRPSFFHARIENAFLDCHPERVKLLTSTTGGQ